MKLTVLIPVFNTPSALLKESVLSIVKQNDGEKHDIILIDDGSTSEHTIEMMKFLKEKERVGIIVLGGNNGTGHALNTGHQEVRTEYVAIQGSDDFSYPFRFKMQLAYLKKNPKTDVLGGQLFGFYNGDPKRKAIFTTAHPEKPRGYAKNPNWLVNHGTVIYRQSSIVEVGGYQKQGRAQDVELWGRMKKAGYVFRNIPSVVYQWRRYK